MDSGKWPVLQIITHLANRLIGRKSRIKVSFARMKQCLCGFLKASSVNSGRAHSPAITMPGTATADAERAGNVSRQS